MFNPELDPQDELKEIELTNLETEQTLEKIFEKNKPVIDEVCSVVLENWLSGNKGSEVDIHNWSKKHQITGDFNGAKYCVKTPHLRKGKHAFVGIVDIENLDKSNFSCVIRDNVKDAEEYLKSVASEPIITELVPKLYGIVKGFVIMEKLSGLELEEIFEKLKVDKEFIQKYADNAYDLVDKTASKCIEMHDVKFVDGHNCMVDAITGEIKIIEQVSFHPNSIFKPQEIIVDQLFTEINQIGRNLDEINPSRVDLVFQILRRAFKHNNPENLYRKSRSLKPTHPRYKNAWYMQNMEELTEQEHQDILNNPKAREAFTVNYIGRGFTEAFSPEFIEAVNGEDMETFKKLIKERKYKIDITDKNDPRYGAEIVPDDR